MEVHKTRMQSGIAIVAFAISCPHLGTEHLQGDIIHSNHLSNEHLLSLKIYQSSAASLKSIDAELQQI